MYSFKSMSPLSSVQLYLLSSTSPFSSIVNGKATEYDAKKIDEMGTANECQWDMGQCFREVTACLRCKRRMVFGSEDFFGRSKREVHFPHGERIHLHMNWGKKNSKGGDAQEEKKLKGEYDEDSQKIV